VLRDTFLEACLETGEIPEPDDHLLKDAEAEKRLGIDLRASSEKASANKGQLLRGFMIYCTEGLAKGHAGYQAIAEANGATFNLFRARGGSTIRRTTAEQDGYAEPDPVYLLTSAKPEERALWPRFEEVARAGHCEPRIVAVEWLLEKVLRQDTKWDERFSLKNFKGGASQSTTA
jgi:hypothetical protein